MSSIRVTAVIASTLGLAACDVLGPPREPLAPASPTGYAARAAAARLPQADGLAQRLEQGARLSSTGSDGARHGACDAWPVTSVT